LTKKSIREIDGLVSGRLQGVRRCIRLLGSDDKTYLLRSQMRFRPKSGVIQNCWTVLFKTVGRRPILRSSDGERVSMDLRAALRHFEFGMRRPHRQNRRFIIKIKLLLLQ